MWYLNLAYEYLVPKVECAFFLEAVSPGHAHTITIDGRAFTHIESATDGNAGVAAGLVAALSACPDVTASVGANTPETGPVNQVNIRGRRTDGTDINVAWTSKSYKLRGVSAASIAAALAGQINATDWAKAGSLFPLQAQAQGATIQIGAVAIGSLRVSATLIDCASIRSAACRSPASIRALASSTRKRRIFDDRLGRLGLLEAHADERDRRVERAGLDVGPRERLDRRRALEQPGLAAPERLLKEGDRARCPSLPKGDLAQPGERDGVLRVVVEALAVELLRVVELAEPEGDLRVQRRHVVVDLLDAGGKPLRGDVQAAGELVDSWSDGIRWPDSSREI